MPLGAVYGALQDQGGVVSDEGERMMCKSYDQLVSDNRKLESEIAELRVQLKAAQESEQCWIFNAKALQKDYNILDAKLRGKNEGLKQLREMAYGNEYDGADFCLKIDATSAL